MGIIYSKFSSDEYKLIKLIDIRTLNEDVKCGKIDIVMTNSLEDAVIAKVIKVYDDDTLSILTVNNLSSTLAFTPYSVRIIDKPIFIKNSLSKLILGKIVKIENISVDSDGYLLCKVSTYNWTNTNDVTKLTAVFGANGILYMQEKDRSYSHGIPHIT